MFISDLNLVICMLEDLNVTTVAFCTCEINY